MESQDVSPPDAQASWEYVALSQYVLPAAPTRERVRQRWRGFWDRLRQAPGADGAVVPPESLQSVPPFLLERAAPEPSWKEAVSGLEALLETWSHAEDAVRPIQVLIGTPNQGTLQALRAWARGVDWQEVREPTYDQILQCQLDWLEQLEHSRDTPLVIPRLERCYLRHANGLDLARHLIDRLLSSGRRCVIGCDSWAWAYLGRAIGVDTLMPGPWALRALDSASLSTWFQTLAARSERYTFAFRQADNGRYVLPPSQDRLQPLGGAVRTSDYLKYVAAYSRGIAGVAWAVWRQSLRTTPDEKLDTAKDDSPSAIRRYTVWLQPWDQLNLPVLPEVGGRNNLLVVHALLLHGGLSGEILPQLLPLSATEARQALTQLRGMGLVEEQQGSWMISILGYPAVRQLLAYEGFLVDAF